MSLRHGFDVSGFQGPNVPVCDFAFVKAGEGSGYTSGSFSAQWASAKTRAAVRGAYHFARPEQSSGASQADRLIAIARPTPGEMLCLDLEASQLSQSGTNSWAKAFGDRLRAKAPGVTTVLYMGSGYAASATGKGLKDHFDYWWYPQYPTAYQLIELPAGLAAREHEEELRAANRSHATPDRAPIDMVTHSWPPSMSPWRPSGITTGWDHPDLWQFTDNFSGLDASVTALTVDQLRGGSPTPTPTPTEEDRWFLGTST